MTLEHFEKLILLFKRHEVLNGGRYERTNRVAQQSLSSLTQYDIERLANKHELEPVGEEPWKKYFVGGSDDHGGLFVGSCYTEVLVEEMTKEALLDGIRNGYTSACGKTDGSLTLSHQMISIAYQYIVEKFDSESSKEELMLKWIFSRNGKKDYYAKQFEKEIKRDARKKFFSLKLNSDKKDEFNLIDEIRSIIEEKPELKKLFRDKLTDEEFNIHFFTLTTELLDRLVVKVVEVPSIFKTLIFLAPAVLSAYMISMASVHQDNVLLRQVESVAGIQKPKKVAWFTDRYHGVDGVVMTIEKFLAASFEYDCDLTVVISDDKTEHPEGIKSFPAITDFQLPMYSNIVGQLYVPSFLRVARWMEEEEFDSVVISTPGPMGFAGMIAGKILGLPITAIYHTDLPRYSYELTGDSMFADVVKKLTKVFYDQANRILVPSKHYAEELMSWGIYVDKIGFMKRWVDKSLFTPKKRNGYFGNDKRAKLLYVGRISKEKNLDLLLKAHSELIVSYGELQDILCW